MGIVDGHSSTECYYEEGHSLAILNIEPKSNITSTSLVQLVTQRVNILPIEFNTSIRFEKANACQVLNSQDFNNFVKRGIIT